MGVQLMDNAAALSMFFTDDIYLVSEGEVTGVVKQDEKEPVGASVVNLSSAVEVNPVVPAADAVIDVSVVASQVVPAPVVSSPVFKYMGKNQRHVLILVNDKENDVSTERGRELLRNIVKAIQLSASDFALVNYSGYRTAQFRDFAGFFSCRLVLAFGIAPTELGLAEYPQNKLVLEDGIQMVFAGNLDLLAADQNGKKILWGSLKQLSI